MYQAQLPHIVHTSVEDARNTLRAMVADADPARALSTVEAALAAERAKPAPRASLITLIERAGRQLREAIASEAAVVSAEEGLELDWQAARETLAATLHHGRLMIVGQVLTGSHLARIKTALGFAHGGDRKSTGHDVRLKSWPDYVAENFRLPGAKITSRTADRLIGVFRAAEARLKRLGHDRAAALLSLAPSETSGDERREMIRLVGAVTDGATQRELLEELRLVSVPSAPPPPDPAARAAAREGEGGGATAEATPAAAAEQLAFAFFHEPARAVFNLRTAKDLDLHLLALPLTPDRPDEPALTTLEEDLTALLDSVRRAKAAKIAHLQLQH